jgi:hypothetical protein
MHTIHRHGPYARGDRSRTHHTATSPCVGVLCSFHARAGHRPRRDPCRRERAGRPHGETAGRLQLLPAQPTRSLARTIVRHPPSALCIVHRPSQPYSWVTDLSDAGSLDDYRMTGTSKTYRFKQPNKTAALFPFGYGVRPRTALQCTSDDRVGLRSSSASLLTLLLSSVCSALLHIVRVFGTPREPTHAVAVRPDHAHVHRHQHWQRRRRRGVLVGSNLSH